MRAHRSDGRPHRVAVVDVAVIVATLVVNVFVVWYERRRGRELGSVVSARRRGAHRQRHARDAAWRSRRSALARDGWPGSTRCSRSCVALIIAWSGFQILRDVDSRARRRARDRRRTSCAMSSSRVPEIRDVRNSPVALDRVGAAVRRGDDRGRADDSGRRRASTRGCGRGGDRARVRHIAGDGAHRTA